MKTKNQIESIGAVTFIGCLLIAWVMSKFMPIGFAISFIVAIVAMIWWFATEKAKYRHGGKYLTLEEIYFKGNKEDPFCFSVLFTNTGSGAKLLHLYGNQRLVGRLLLVKGHELNYFACNEGDKVFVQKDESGDYHLALAKKGSQATPITA